MLLMTTYNKGEVYLADVIFTDGSEIKKRPVVIVSGKEYNNKRDEIIVSAITSNIIRKIYGDIPIKNWSEAGLLYPSVATGLLFTIKKDLLGKRLGNLSDVDLIDLNNSIASNLELLLEQK